MVFSKGGGLDMRYSQNQSGNCLTRIFFLIIVLGVVLALLRECGIDPLKIDAEKEVENKYHPVNNPWGE